MKKIIEYIKKPENQRYILLACLIIVFLLVIQNCNRSKKEEMVMNQNIASLSDTLRIVKTKNGELEFAKKLLITNASELKKMNDSLYKELKKENGDVKYIYEETVRIKHDTLIVPTIVKKDNLDYTLYWDYEKKSNSWYKKISGTCFFNWDSVEKKPINVKTIISNDLLDIKIVGGFRYIDGFYETFVRSDYPNVSINFQSAIVDKEMITKLQKKWHIGIGANVGFSGYLTKLKIIQDPTYSIGISIVYTPFDFCNF